MLRLLLLCAGVSAQQAATRVPEMHVTSFSGKAVTLPQDLQGKVGVLIAGFTQSPRVLVVNGRGGVLWQTHGAFSEAVYGELKERVEGLRSGIGHPER